jgi:hypothetical protein
MLILRLHPRDLQIWSFFYWLLHIGTRSNLPSSPFLLGFLQLDLSLLIHDLLFVDFVLLLVLLLEYMMYLDMMIW